MFSERSEAQHVHSSTTNNKRSKGTGCSVASLITAVNAVTGRDLLQRRLTKEGLVYPLSHRR